MLKIGDKVKVVSNENWYGKKYGDVGTITKTDYGGIFVVDFCCNGSKEPPCRYYQHQLEKINPVRTLWDV